MHERSRRNLCRIAFIAFCVAPTLATLTWAGYRVSPLYAAAERSDWEQKLFDLTGLLATIDGVAHTSGGSTLLAGIECVDPDGGERVLRIRQAEIARTDQGIVVVLSQPELSEGKFLRVWDTLHDRVLRGPLPDTPIQVTTGELTLEVGGQAQTFTRVRCTVEPHPGGIRALLDFQLAGLEMPSPAQLQIDRNRQMVPPTTHWSLRTNTPIPCSLFSDYLPALARLGSHCVFQGTVATTSTRRHWSGEISGKFSQIDLQAAMDPFPHRLSGFADLTVREAVIEQGRLIEAAGEVVGSEGVISTSLLSALGKQLGAGVPPDLSETAGPYIPYQMMAFQFALSSAEWTVLGSCSNTTPDVILASSRGPILIGDQDHRYPLLGLVRALSPASEWLVPATEESKGLVDVLVLPTSHIETPVIASPPRARVRLGK